VNPANQRGSWSGIVALARKNGWGKGKRSDVVETLPTTRVANGAGGGGYDLNLKRSIDLGRDKCEDGQLAGLLKAWYGG